MCGGIGIRDCLALLPSRTKGSQCCDHRPRSIPSSLSCLRIIKVRISFFVDRFLPAVICFGTMSIAVNIACIRIINSCRSFCPRLSSIIGLALHISAALTSLRRGVAHRGRFPSSSFQCVHCSEFLVLVHSESQRPGAHTQSQEDMLNPYNRCLSNHSNPTDFQEETTLAPHPRWSSRRLARLFTTQHDQPFVQMRQADMQMKNKPWAPFSRRDCRICIIISCSLCLLRIHKLRFNQQSRQQLGALESARNPSQ